MNSKTMLLGKTSIIFCLINFILFSSLCMHLVAQNGQFDVRFTVKNFDCPNNSVIIQVQVKAHDAQHAFLMGDANYRFDYNPSVIANPSLISQDNFSSQIPANDSHYAAQNLNGSTTGFPISTVSLNTNYGGGGQGAKLVGTEWLAVSSIRFDILDATKCINLIWHDDSRLPITGMNEIVLTQPVPDGNFDQYIVAAGGIFQNLNLCIPTVCRGVIAIDDINVTTKNIAVSGSVATNDASSSGAMTFAAIGIGTAGSWSIQSNGNYTFTPTTDFKGTAVQFYQVCNASGQCDTAAIYIKVTETPGLPSQNIAPVALNDNAETFLNIAVNGNVLNNDFDVDGHTLTLTTTPIRNPTSGDVTLNANGNFTYTPHNNFIGQDTFLYRICDNGTPSKCDTAQVIITVKIDNNDTANDRPNAQDDAVAAYKGTMITASLALNDSDPNGNTLTYNILPPSGGNPTHGSVTIEMNGRFIYTPSNATYSGTDQFKYVVCDNGSPSLCDTATVYIVLFPRPYSPPVIEKTSKTTAEDTPLQFCLNITDINVGDTFTASLQGQPTFGLASSLSVSNNQVCVTYSPSLNYNGKDTISIIVCDQTGLCDTAKIPLSITPVNDKPIITFQPLTFNEDSTITICATYIDPDAGDTHTASQCSQPQHGTTGIIVKGSGFLCINYSPTSNYFGKDTVCLVVCDQGGLCDTAKIPLSILPVNDKPIVTNTPVTTAEDTPIQICQTITDPDVGDTFISTLCNQPLHGVINSPVINGNQICLTYSPTSNYNGQDTVCLIVCDQVGACDTVKIAITITPVNDKPIVTVTPVTLFEDSTVRICSNIVDPDLGDTFTATLCSQPKHGTAQSLVISEGQVCVTYSPTSNYNGKDTICLIVCDNNGLCDTAKIPLSITPVNDKPIIIFTPATTKEDSPITICATVIDPDINDVFTASLCRPPSHGTANAPIMNGNQVCVMYSPTSNYNGKDTLCLIVCDNNGLCDTAKIPITITSVPYPPVIVNRLPTTLREDSTFAVCLTINDSDTPEGLFTVSNCSTPFGGTVTTNLTTNQLCINYLPTANYNGLDTICLIVCDDTGLCDTLRQIITITPVNDAPVVRDSFATTTPSVSVTTCLPIIDPDVADTHFAFTLQNAVYGLVEAQIINRNLCITYTPSINYAGLDSVYLLVCDTGSPLLCDTVKMVYNITSNNLPPKAANDINYTLDGTVTSGNVLTNDTDPNSGQILRASVSVQPKHAATFTLNPNGSYTYTSTTGYIGKDTIHYQVCDNGVPILCDSAILIINIRPKASEGNQRPLAIDDNTSTPSGQAITVNVKANDTDPTGILSNPTIITHPSCGTAVVNINGTVTYTPTPGFIGVCTMLYAVCDNGLPSLCDTAALRVEVYRNPFINNQQPNAVDDALRVAINTSINASVATNDSDPDAGQILSFMPITSPIHGLMTMQANGNYTFTPTMGFMGKDSFRYKVCDNGSPVLCDTATVYLTIANPIGTPTNLAPIANPDNAVTFKDLATTINVKVNDYDPNGDPLSMPTITVAPTCGRATVNTNGTIGFVPNTSFVGSCTFIYQVCDTGHAPNLCDTALITVKVLASPIANNRPPTALNDFFISVVNQPINNASVSFNDSDPDAGQTLTFTTISQPTHGFISFNSSLGLFSFYPTVNFVGRDSFRYKICDNGTPSSLCDTATVYIEYINSPSENLAPIATDDIIEITMNRATYIPVLANDKDPNGTPLSNPVILTQPTCGTTSINEGGTVLFVPQYNFIGTCSFTYKVCDGGSPNLCATATVTVTVYPLIYPNQTPNAQNDATTTAMNTAVNGNVSLNDSDLDVGQMLSFSKTINATHGTAVLQTNGLYVYTPQLNFVGRDSFQYQVCDNGSPNLCATAWVFIEVTTIGVNVNEKPVATKDKVRVTTGVHINIAVKINDYDPNPNQTLSKPMIVTSPSCGTATVNEDGTIGFTSNNGFIGTCTLTYSICDNGSPILCDTTTVTITVTETPVINNINLPPVALDDAHSDYVNVVQKGNVGDNDSDPNAAQTLSFALINAPNHGTVTVTTEGGYSYTPALNYVGTDNFTYKVCDSGSPSLCDTATVYLTVFNHLCVSFDIKVLLEGAYKISTAKMSTSLNQRGLLPGQTPIGQFAIPTPKGQPYKGAPWNYAGTEGDTITTYPSTVVDWVLVSLRSSPSNTTPVWRYAGWLHQDGSITFPKSCIQIPLGSYYIVVEHRNHLGVMSPTAVSIVNNIIQYDFTLLDSYITTNPPSFGSKLLNNGKWAMYSGDGMKTTSTTNFDINFNDAQMWKIESGIFDQYRRGDFNLDADVNFNDQVLWKANNGKYSGVPH